MGRDFSDHTPKWRNDGRTGPNGPRYAKAKDRAKVRNGGKVGKQPTNGPYSWGNGPQPKKGSGGTSKKMLVIAWGLIFIPVSVLVGAAGYILHGHGVL